MAITSMPGPMVCSNQSPRLPQVLWGNSTMATEAVESGDDGSSRGAGQCLQREAAQSIVIELLTRSETGLQELSMVVQVKQVSSLSATKLKYVTSGTGKKNIIFLFLLCITLFYPVKYCRPCGTYSSYSCTVCGHFLGVQAKNGRLFLRQIASPGASQSDIGIGPSQSQLLLQQMDNAWTKKVLSLLLSPNPSLAKSHLS